VLQQQQQQQQQLPSLAGGKPEQPGLEALGLLRSYSVASDDDDDEGIDADAGGSSQHDGGSGAEAAVAEAAAGPRPPGAAAASGGTAQLADDVRAIADKLVAFVAKNGVSFEVRRARACVCVWRRGGGAPLPALAVKLQLMWHCP
jgi:hypothetical protein